MQNSRIHQWINLAAGISVLVGLVFVGFELRQNALLSRTTLEVEKNNLLAEIELSLSSPESAAAWVKSIRSPEQLTDIEVRIVESHLVALMMQWDYLFQMQESGLVTMERVESHIRNTAPYYFGSAHAKNWFQAQKPGWESTMMMTVAEPIVQSLDENFLEKYLDSTLIRGADRTD